MARKRHEDLQPWAIEPDAASMRDVRRFKASVVTNALNAYIEGEATAEQLKLLEGTEQFTGLVTASHYREARHQSVIATERTYKQLFPDPA